MTDGDLYELWLAPDLFIAQTCGFPLTHRLKDRVTLVATPVYTVDGCAGGSYHSVIVARQDSDVRSLDDVAGKVAAFNGYDSQSGWNALRHSLIGKGAPTRILETGGHRKSVAAVREGRADVAAIDCVTYAGLQAACAAGGCAVADHRAQRERAGAAVRDAPRHRFVRSGNAARRASGRDDRSGTRRNTRGDAALGAGDRPVASL